MSDSKAVMELREVLAETLKENDIWEWWPKDIIRKCAAVCDDGTETGEHYARLILSVLEDDDA